MGQGGLTIHYMRNGVTACGLLAHQQGGWPDDHRWVTEGYEADVSCAECRRDANKRLLERFADTDNVVPDRRAHG